MCGFFHEWNSNSMYFSLAWRCRLPNTFTVTHTHRQTPILLIPRQTQICCFMNDYQEQQLNFRCALLITSFFRLPFFLYLLFVFFSITQTFSYRLMCVRQYRERSTPRPCRVLMNGQRCLYRCTWLFPFLPLSPSLCLSVCYNCVATRVFLRFI